MLILGPSDTLLQQVEPIRSHWWSLSLTGPSAVGTLPGIEGLSLRDLPSIGNEQEAIEHTPINNTIKYPGKQLAQSCQLRLIMLDTDPVYDFFVRWRRMCYDPETNLVGLLNEVAGVGYVRIFAPTSSSFAPQNIRTIRLDVVWPSSLIVTGLSRDGEGDPAEYQVMLEIGSSYDVSL